MQSHMLCWLPAGTTLVARQAPLNTPQHHNNAEASTRGPARGREALHSLASHDDIQVILDVLDNFRKEGIDEHVPLPQPVVSGDTSSGKSSVLQRLIKIPFAIGENVVTRFPTLISMRRAPHSEVQISIDPAKTRIPAEQVRLKRFGKDLASLDDYADAHNDAAEMLSSGGQNNTGLLRDVLRVDICGPQCSPLCLVDLPGLIQARRNNLTEADKKMSHSLVEEYLRNPKTIILCVVSATNDYVNQEITDKARKYDPEGARTMGIITKVDAVQGLEKEKAWIELLRNTDNVFKLGWCALVNKIENVEDASPEEIDEAEESFFNHGRFADLDKSRLGLAALRTQLNLAVHANIVQAIPGIGEDIERQLKDAEEGLKKLGEGRTDEKSMRAFLVNLSTKFYHKASNALVSHNYGQDAWFDKMPEITRLRTTVAKLNDDFAHAMLLYGAGRRIKDSTNVDPGFPGTTEVGKKNSYWRWAQDGRPITRDQAIQWVQSEIEGMRGSEVPGEPVPGIEAHLHRQLIAEWETLAGEHVFTVSQVCDTFLQHLLREITGASYKDVLNRLYAHVRQAMSMHIDAATAGMQCLVNDERVLRMTYNRQYSDLVTRQRNSRLVEPIEQTILQQNMANTGGPVQHNSRVVVEYGSLRNTIINSSPSYATIKRQAAEEALDRVTATYRTNISTFIDNVAKQVIEREIMQKIPGLLSVQWASQLGSEELNELVSEPIAVQNKRSELTETRRKMGVALKTFDRELAHLKDKSDAPR